MAKDREERYATAGDLAFELGRVQDRLNHRLVDQWLERARMLQAQSEFAKANGLLREILTIDSNNEAAQRLMEELESELRREHRLRLVRQMCDLAKQAAARQAYDEAIGYLDKGAAITKSSEALEELRAQILSEKSRAEQELQQATKAVLDVTRSATDVAALDIAAEQIQNLRNEYGNAPPVLSAAYEFENRRGGLAERAVSEAIRRGRDLMQAREYRPIPELLSSISAWLPYASSDLQARYHALNRDAAEAIESDEAADPGDLTMIAGSDDLNNVTRISSADGLRPGLTSVPPPAQISSPAAFNGAMAVHPFRAHGANSRQSAPMQSAPSMNTLGNLALNPSLLPTPNAVRSQDALEAVAELEKRPSRRRLLIGCIVAVLVLFGVVLFGYISNSRSQVRETPARVTQPKTESSGAPTMTAKPSVESPVAVPAASEMKLGKVQPSEVKSPKTTANQPAQEHSNSKAATENTSKESERIRGMINEAQAEMDEGHYDDAISTYAAALQLDSHNSAALNGKRRAEKAKQYEQQLEETQ